MQRLGKGRGKQKKDNEAEASGGGLFSMMEIEVRERESRRGWGGQRALASHLPAEPTWWQQGLCHFGIMNIHHRGVTSNTYMAVNPERCALVNLITRWWKGTGNLSLRVAETEGAAPQNGQGLSHTGRMGLCSFEHSGPSQWFDQG